MRKLFFTAIFYGLFVLPTLSQRMLTIEECVQIAINNDLQVKQNGITYEKYTRSYTQSKMERLPDLNANTQHSVNFGRSLDYTTYDFSNQTLQNNSFGLNSSATVFNGNRIRNNLKLQKKYVSKAQADTESTKQDISVQVALNFLQVLLAKEQIGTAENQQKRTEQDLERITKQITAGAISESSQYDVEAQLASARFRVVQAQNAHETALLALKQSLFIPFAEDIDVVRPPIVVPPKAYLNELLPEKVFSAALIGQHNMESARQSEQIAALNINLAKAYKYPVVTVSGGINSYHSSEGKEIKNVLVYTDVPLPGVVTSVDGEQLIQSSVETPTFGKTPFLDQVDQNLSQSLSLGISIPIFNRGQVNNQIKQAELDLLSAQLNTTLAAQVLEQKIQNAYLDADLAYRRYESVLAQKAALQKALEYAQKRYDLGAGSVFDYFAAQNNLTATQLEEAQAKYDLVYKIKVLEYYRDNSFSF